eukprot:4326200-Prymnesium_polylepis.1
MLQAQINFSGFTSPAAHEDWVLRASKGIQWCRLPAAGSPPGHHEGSFYRPYGGVTFGSKPNASANTVVDENYDQRPFCPYQGEFSPQLSIATPGFDPSLDRCGDAKA